METIYLVLFFLGLGTAILAGIMSDAFSGPPEDRRLILHPVVLSTFAALTGAMGYAGSRVFGWNPEVHIPTALTTGLAGADLLCLLLIRARRRADAEKRALTEKIVGREAEVLIAIPRDGLGKISYSLNERGYTAPARAEDGEELPSGTIVRIDRVENGMFYVRRTFR